MTQKSSRSLARALVFSLLISWSPAIHADAKCRWRKTDDILFTDLDSIRGELGDVPVAGLQEDLACLRLILNKSYLASDHYRTASGISLDHRAKTLASSLSAPMDQEKFLDQLIALHTGTQDLHLSYSFRTPQGTSKRLIPRPTPYLIPDFDPAILADCPGFKRTQVITPGGQISDRWIGQPVHGTVDVACNTRDGRVARQRVEPVVLDRLDPSLSTFSWRPIENRNAVYVRIPTYMFPGGIPQPQLDFLKFLETMPDDTSLIIDQRQGNGGAPLFAFEITKRLLQRNAKIVVTRAKIRMGALAIGGLANTFLVGWKTAEELGNADDARSYETAYRRTIDQLGVFGKLGPRFFVDLARPYPGGTGQRLTNYSGRVIVLTDKECGSACEFMPGVLPGLLPKGQVTVIGTHTLGAIRFSSPGMFLLPNSKVIFRGGSFGLGMDRNTLVPEEGYGAAPDYYPIGIDGLEAALLLL